jgi:hypothetical protein
MDVGVLQNVKINLIIESSTKTDTRVANNNNELKVLSWAFGN